MVFLGADREAEYQQALLAHETISKLFFSGELPFYPDAPISKKRLKELVDEAISSTPDAIEYLHRKERRMRSPFTSICRVDRNTLRRMRRVAAKELEALG